VVLAPGLGLILLIGGVAVTAQWVEVWLLGQPFMEGLVIALLLGMCWANLRGVSEPAKPGVRLMGKGALELAVVFLGAAVDFPELLQAGPPLLGAIVLAVGSSILASYCLGRLFGLNPRLAGLVAVGNSICGNSAIAAVAPVIAAKDEEVASAISLTAILGVVVILLLPAMIPLLGLTLYQYGVLAGMTVYAVPQVVAAAFPVSELSGQVAMMVKLVRVLLLGPVVVGIGLCYHVRAPRGLLYVQRFVPWFIVGFLLLALLRSLGLLPGVLVDVLRMLGSVLMVGAMAALGLGVDVRLVGRVGARVAAAVIVSLGVLLGISLLFIRSFGID
jgi:uncharacterized integral membrane protein (TIGR00698 family)